jgi:hypothetical protein
MRRQVRKAREHPWIVFFQGFTILFGVVVAVGRVPVPRYESLWSVPGGYVLGGRLATDGPAVLETLRGFAGVLFALLLFLTVLKEVTDGSMDSHVESVLLSAGAHSVAAGNVFWNLLLTGVQFGALVLAGGIALGAGSGSTTVVVTVAIAGVAMLVTAVPLGYVLALAVGVAFRRVPFVREHRAILGAPLAVAYFALFLRARESMAVLGDSPLGWYADAALAFEGAGAVSLRAAAVVAVAPVALVGLTALSVRVGSALWYHDDPGGAEGSPERERDSGGPLDWLLRRVVTRPTAAVTRTVWRRLRREPRTLLFAALPIALTGSVGVEIANRRPAAVPVVVGVYGAATVGMGATLNPLGSLGGGLPTALTAPDGGRHVVRGYLLSAALPGVPVVATGAFLGAVAVGATSATALALAGVAAALALAAPAVSMAVGVALPNLEGLRPAGSGIRPPRLWATTVFLLLVATIGVPALVGVGWAGPLASAAGTAPATVAAGGVLATVGLAGAAGAVSYRRSVVAIAGYEIE